MIRTILSLLLLFCGLGLMAQQTGSFSLVIDFNEADFDMTNELAFYVPLDYDSALSYPLIVGFRGGPHSGPGHLRNQMQPLSDSLDCIIMCPESVDLWQGSQEDLVKQLFQYSVDTTASMYSIDMSMIYVTGLSFGGRHTVIAGMDIDAGPIYPGLRGLIPFGAGSNSHTVADYGQDTSAPLCVCIGANDASFISVSEDLYQGAIDGGHTAFYNEIPGVGHTMDFPTFIEEMMECFNFIEAQYVSNLLEHNSFDFEAYPNPATDLLTIRGPIDGLPHVEIFDASGRMIHTHGLMPSVGVGSIDVSDWPSGNYLIRMVKKEKTTSSGQIVRPAEMSTKWIVKE